MSVRWREDKAVALSGDSGLDDAEPLLHMLSAHPGAPVDWRQCEGAHAAILQILMASGAAIIGPPQAAHLRNVVEPALTRYRERGFREDP
jgi:hypothetical protein